MTKLFSLMIVFSLLGALSACGGGGGSTSASGSVQTVTMPVQVSAVTAKQ